VELTIRYTMPDVRCRHALEHSDVRVRIGLIRWLEAETADILAETYHVEPWSSMAYLSVIRCIR